MTSAEGLKEAESGKPFCISASLPLDWVFLSWHRESGFLCYVSFVFLRTSLLSVLRKWKCADKKKNKVIFSSLLIFQDLGAYRIFMGCSQLLIIIICFPGYSELERITLKCTYGQRSSGWPSRDGEEVRQKDHRCQDCLDSTFLWL